MFREECGEAGAFDKQCTLNMIVHAVEIGHSLMHVSVQLVQMPSVSISTPPTPLLLL